jgi:hypothetical protein
MTNNEARMLIDECAHADFGTCHWNAFEMTRDRANQGIALWIKNDASGVILRAVGQIGAEAAVDCYRMGYQDAEDDANDE